MAFSPLLPLDGARPQGIASMPPPGFLSELLCSLNSGTDRLLLHFRNVFWCCTMIITTPTSRGRRSGEAPNDLMTSFATFIPIFFVQCRGGDFPHCETLFLFFCLFSLGVALSRGHGKFFFTGNVTVEEG